MVSTAFVGVGNQVEELMVDNEQDELLDNLAFYCYDDSDFGSAKYEHLKEKIIEESPNGIDVVETESQSIISNPIESSVSPPMDSPWPMKCHDMHHTSRSPFSTTYNSGYEKWRYECDEVESSAVIGDDGTIYFGSMDWFLYALNPDGTEKWRYKTGFLIWSAPAIAEDGTIYVGSWDDYLHAVNPNGTRKWRFCAHDDICSSPAIAEDGTIYFGTMLSGNRIYAVNPNGTEKWRYKTGDVITSDPAIGEDGTIYIGSCDNYLYAMNPNGTLKWRFKTGDEIKGHASIADDGTIYFPSFDDNLYALYPNGTLKWKTNTEWGASSSAAIADDGTIYVGTDKLRAIYPNNGTIKWTLDVGGDIAHASPAVSADGTIYVSAGLCLVAVNQDGTEKWRRQICDVRADSSPIIAEDGTIYVGSTSKDENTHFWYGYLHAFGAGGEVIAEANGPYYGLIDEAVEFSGDADFGYPPYTWQWDFGDGNTSNEQNPTHIYTNVGNYTVTLTVTDNKSSQSVDTAWAWVQESNDPPEKPTIEGELNGKINTEYGYTFLSSDPEGLHIWYYIEWGDDHDTGWIGPYPSGEKIDLSHKWNYRDTYIIRCKAKDPYGAESDWGELRVTMPHTFWWFNGLLDRFPLLQRLMEGLIR